MVIPAADPSLGDAANKFEDLSGVEIKPGDNPYDALINACDGSPVSSFFLLLLENDKLLDYGGKETDPASKCGARWKLAEQGGAKKGRGHRTRMRGRDREPESRSGPVE